MRKKANNIAATAATEKRNQLSIIHMNLFGDKLCTANLLFAADTDVVANTARKIESRAHANKEDKTEPNAWQFEDTWWPMSKRGLPRCAHRASICASFSLTITSSKQNECLENNICIEYAIFSSINLKSFTRCSNCNHCKCLQTHCAMLVSVNKFQMNFYAHLIMKSHIGQHKSIFQVILIGYGGPILITFQFSSPFGANVGLWLC